MLKIYPFIVETVAMLAPIVKRVARQDPDLARQMRKAGSSIVLNTAEGIGVAGGNEKVRFRTALGSNQEIRACLDVAEAWSYVDTIDPILRDRFDRIAATLYRLAT